VQGKLTFTGRIAGFSFRHKWWVLAVWLIMLVGSGAAASGMGKVLSTEMKDLSGSESAKAKDLIEDRLGKQPLTETLVIRNEQLTADDPSFQSLVNDLSRRIGLVKGVQGVMTYLEAGDPSMVSADRHAALTSIRLGTDPDKAEDDVVPVVEAVKAAARDNPSFQVHLTGPASGNHEWNTIAEKDLAAAERLGLPIALIVMVIAFGALIAAGVPLLLALASIGMAMGSVALIGRAFELSFFVTNIITMIGLAVGIDYSLFIIGRYREELARGHNRYEAMVLASETSGRAVFFSGMTVLLALAGMLLVRNSIFISIGIGAMVVTAYAIVASLTLLPALLSVIGRGINWLRVPYLGKAGYGTRFWGAVTNVVQRRPAVFVVLSAGLLIAAAVPLTTIDIGANGVETMPKDTQTYQAVKALERDFAAGRTDPVQVVVDGDINSQSVSDGIARFQQAIQARGDLQWLSVRPDESGRTALIEVATTVIGTGEEAQQIVKDLRNDLVPQAFAGSGARVLVGGNLPIFVDGKTEMNGKLPVVFGFVLGLSFILMLLVFRSIAIPAKAIVMNLLSVGAAYGLVVLVFQHGFLADQLGLIQTPQIEFWLPLFLFSILFGLSMDYHVFLLSRVKEEYTRTGNNKEAVRTGVKSTAGMITSAAVIMVAVFAAFASGSIAGIQQMGFGLAVAVFLDATIIRSVLVPASMQLLGKYNWWMPSWLNWLPKLNVEGAVHRLVPQPVPVLADDVYAAGD
jgi:RND superfamily putative drug exporter